MRCCVVIFRFRNWTAIYFLSNGTCVHKEFEKRNNAGVKIISLKTSLTSAILPWARQNVRLWQRKYSGSLKHRICLRGLIVPNRYCWTCIFVLLVSWSLKDLVNITKYHDSSAHPDASILSKTAISYLIINLSFTLTEQDLFISNWSSDSSH